MLQVMVIELSFLIVEMIVTATLGMEIRIGIYASLELL